MLWDIFILIAGLALIMGGANILTDGASALARRWGVSDLVVDALPIYPRRNWPSASLPPFRAIPG